MKEYNDMAMSVHTAYKKELLKYERYALEAAIKAAQTHGLSDEDAKLFAENLIDTNRKSLHVPQN